MIRNVLFMLLCLQVSLFSFSVDTVVPFQGSLKPAAMFYIDTPYKPDILVGFSAEVPALKTEELDVDLKIGATLDLPLFGVINSFFVADNHGGRKLVEGYQDSEFHFRSLRVTKNWLYPFNDRFTVGIETILGELYLDGTYKATVLPAFYPVVATTLTF